MLQLTSLPKEQKTEMCNNKSVECDKLFDIYLQHLKNKDSNLLCIQQA